MPKYAGSISGQLIPLNSLQLRNWGGVVLVLCKGGIHNWIKQWGEGEKTKIKGQITSVPVLGNDINNKKISSFFHILYHPT